MEGEDPARELDVERRKARAVALAVVLASEVRLLVPVALVPFSRFDHSFSYFRLKRINEI